MTVTDQQCSGLDTPRTHLITHDEYEQLQRARRDRHDLANEVTGLRSQLSISKKENDQLRENNASLKGLYDQAIETNNVLIAKNEELKHQGFRRFIRTIDVMENMNSIRVDKENRSLGDLFASVEYRPRAMRIIEFLSNLEQSEYDRLMDPDIYGGCLEPCWEAAGVDRCTIDPRTGYHIDDEAVVS